MKKQIILSSLLSALLIGNCLDTQAANEARTINDLPSMAKVSQNKREVSPEFPGGITALVTRIFEIEPSLLTVNFTNTLPCIFCSLQTVGNFRFFDKNCTKSVDPYLDKEAVRVVKSMPRWIPGTQDGKPVNVEYTLPITFKL